MPHSRSDGSEWLTSSVVLRRDFAVFFVQMGRHWHHHNFPRTNVGASLAPNGFCSAFSILIDNASANWLAISAILASLCPMMPNVVHLLLLSLLLMAQQRFQLLVFCGQLRSVPPVPCHLFRQLGLLLGHLFACVSAFGQMSVINVHGAVVHVRVEETTNAQIFGASLQLGLPPFICLSGGQFDVVAVAEVFRLAALARRCRNLKMFQTIN